jgi:hypothetical protein
MRVMKIDNNFLAHIYNYHPWHIALCDAIRNLSGI